MKKLLFIALLLTATPALAQTVPVASGQNVQHFEQKKAEMIQKINTRITEMQQRQSCVQGAANGEALKACSPNRGEHHGKKNGCGPEAQ